jgi:hypothetical protein
LQFVARHVHSHPQFGVFVACVLRPSAHLPRMRRKPANPAVRRFEILNPRLRVAASKAGSNKTKQEQIMNEYKPAYRPAAFGALAVALTAMTIGLAVVLPAKMDARSLEVRTVAAPPPASAPVADRDSGPIRIDVVAERGNSWTPVHTQLIATKSGHHGSGRIGAHAVAAPKHLGRADGGLQRAVCPYLTKGTVAATS